MPDPSAHQTPVAARRLSPLVVAQGLAVALALTPFLAKLVVLGVWAAGERAPIYVDGDDAVLELYTLYAARGEQLVGPYSRYEWSHPGPLYFYLLAPLYELLDRHALALHLGALLINLAAVGGMLWLARRLGGAALLFPVAVAVALHAAYFGAARLDHPWNPFVMLLPFGLFLLLAGAVASGTVAGLPALLGLATILVQSHLGYGPSALLLGGAAAVPLLRCRAGRRVAALSVLAALGLWLPPLYQQAAEDPGNLTLIARFVAAGQEPPVGLAGGLIGLAQYLDGPIAFVAGWMRPVTPDWAAPPVQIVVAGCLAALLVLSAIRARAGASPGPTALARVCLLGLPVAVVSLAAVRGPLHYYLALWVGVLGLVGWAAVAAALWPRRGPARTAGVAAALLLSGWAAAVGVAQVWTAGLPAPDAASARIEALYRPIAAAEARRPLLRIAGPDQWQPLAGLALRLEKEGRPFAVEAPWWPIFGRAHAPRGDEDADLRLDGGGPVPQGARLLTDAGGVRLTATGPR